MRKFSSLFDYFYFDSTVYSKFTRRIIIKMECHDIIFINNFAEPAIHRLNLIIKLYVNLSRNLFIT